MLSRLVRVVNVSLAVLAIVFAALIYWFAVRPLPQISGELTAPVSAPATITRDALGVPHIEAASWQDAIFLQGYATAQDRLWQMDALRRYAAGELAELAGPAAVAIDQRARVLRMRPMAEADVAHLSPEERETVVQYARGVNYFIDTHRGDYSLEFSIPGHAYDPRPWTLADSMLVGLLMFRDMTDVLSTELSKANIFDMGADAGKFHLLFPPSEGGALSPGSNAWSVSGAHTASGKPLVANDPHLHYAVPGTWHMVHLKAPGLNVSGVALPGVPCVISGHNENIAWGVTNLETSVMDVYREQIDQRTGQYQFQGKTEQAKLDQQLIAVKDGKPVTFNLWVTRHGPVITDNGKAYSIRWTAGEGFGFPFLKLNQAKNWNDFRAAISVFWGPSQNFVYGDRAGNIGYQVAGRLPIRHNYDGDLPVDGASGQFEWDGFIPFEQLPSFYNPADGIIATANQNPFPKDYPYRISGFFADDYRVHQIRALLAAKPKLNVDDMLAIQKDVYSGYDLLLARQVVAAYNKLGKPAANGLMAEAVNVLQGWNGQMEGAEAGPAIAELLSQELRQSLVKCLLPNAKQQPDVLPRPQVLEALLRSRPAGWVPNDNWDAWLVANFSHALDAGREKLGSSVPKWRWGQILEWTFEHPIIKRLPPVEWLFDLIYQRKSGPFEMSGASTTVKQTTPTLGPSERMVADLGDLDHSVQNIVLGESGFVSSVHFEDQWPAYYSGKSFPMQFDHVAGKDVLRVKPQ